MCDKNSMQLSLKGDTFQALKEDFDNVLARTIGNMEMKCAGEATITIKLGITLEKVKKGFTEAGNSKEITMPSFKHDISSVMQVKDKKSGALTGDYQLVWDDEEKQYIMRRIEDGQMSLFDSENKKSEYEEPVMSITPMLEAPVSEQEIIEVDFKDNSDNGVSSTDSSDSDVFYWFKDFVGCDMKIVESDGNYSVRTLDNRVILTSSSSPDNIFHCDADLLASHIDDELHCCIKEDDGNSHIYIECKDGSALIFCITKNSGESEQAEVDVASLDEAEHSYEPVIDDNSEDDCFGESESYDYDEPESFDFGEPEPVEFPI